MVFSPKKLNLHSNLVVWFWFIPNQSSTPLEEGFWWLGDDKSKAKKDMEKGSSINHVVKFWVFFTPPPSSWSLLLNNADVIKC